MEMESPFFRSHWNYPQRPRCVPSMMEVPVQRRMVPVAPKVVSIPVRFVESEKSRSRCDSATKIQKAFRGFLVRTSVKKVMAIEREVNEIERRLADEETVELIRRDAKERLKFGETLMNLLFMLDSVKGVDSGIRNFRKAVIKKAITLQEKVDSIVAGTAECDSEAVDRSSDMNASGARENRESADGCDGDTREIESADCCNEIEESAPSSRKSNVLPEVPGSEVPEQAVTSETDSSTAPNSVETAGMEEREEDKQRRKVVERMMMMENKKMMEMMEKLFERNEMQTRMLSSLSQRVEQLEKALVYQMLRRKKKKKKNSAAIVDGSEKWKCPQKEELW